MIDVECVKTLTWRFELTKITASISSNQSLASLVYFSSLSLVQTLKIMISLALADLMHKTTHQYK